MKIVYLALYIALVALPLASRPKAQAFDHIGTLELSRAYARELGKVFGREPSLPLDPPLWLLHLLGISKNEITGAGELAATTADAAELAADREGVAVTVLH